MIVCPNCNHQNPDGAVQCESCYTPLPATTACPNCGAKVQVDASFCGQCGFNLKAMSPVPQAPVSPAAIPVPEIQPDLEVSPLAVEPQPLPETPPIPSVLVEPSSAGMSGVEGTEEAVALGAVESLVGEATAPDAVVPVASQAINHTQLQQQTARLLHTQTDTTIELPQNVSVVHLGKPNDRIPPDIDVSGFPNSEIVSRIHADIRVEGEAYYIEDVGSSNGTYINNLPLPMGNRHRLRPGDRIALGKGDKVTFLFQLS
ncbi:MAG: FHA domain-containing protein [Leptolyngbyaceae cyanobacterium bins.302]|nr:FHA domain-containing protein [Leptolyngbyaceae cyanobacterium bins.302]